MTGVVMVVLTVFLGLLLGLLGGALLSIRMVKQQVSADLLPTLSRMQGQLNTIEAEVGYMVNSRYAELSARLTPEARQPNL
jgi:MFS superfamily sulfate permease-like transporter